MLPQSLKPDLLIYKDLALYLDYGHTFQGPNEQLKTLPPGGSQEFKKLLAQYELDVDRTLLEPVPP